MPSKPICFDIAAHSVMSVHWKCLEKTQILSGPGAVSSAAAGASAADAAIAASNCLRETDGLGILPTFISGLLGYNRKRGSSGQSAGFADARQARGRSARRREMDLRAEMGRL